MARFTLRGVDELTKKLKALRGAEAKRVFRSAMREVGKIVQGEAKRRAPVGETGKLSRLILVRSIPRSRKRIGVNVRPAERTRFGISAKAKGYYPAHVHFGSRKRGIAKRPYLRDALEDNRERLIRFVERRVGEGIEELAKRS